MKLFDGQVDAYEYLDGVFCEYCIPEVMLMNEPLVSARITEEWDSTDEALDIFAKYMGVDRDDIDSMTRNRFPTKITPVPDTFCGECLRWFTDNVPNSFGIPNDRKEQQ